MDDLEIIKRLCLSAFLGGALGWEREWRQKSAGLRTNILVALGSTLFTIMSIDLAARSGGDPTRIAAQIVTGVGFLGAGAILRTGAGVRGLTTAAMIWVNSAVGVAVGGGEYRIALLTTGVTVAVLLALVPVERVIDRLRPEKREIFTAGGSAAAGGTAPSPEPPDDPLRPRRP